MTTTLVSEQSTKLSKGHEVVSSRFQIAEYCLIPKTELAKTEDMSSLEVVSSRYKAVQYCLPQAKILRIEAMSSLEVLSS